jgi:hypothetical protein
MHINLFVHIFCNCFRAARKLQNLNFILLFSFVCSIVRLLSILIFKKNILKNKFIKFVESRNFELVQPKPTFDHSIIHLFLFNSIVEIQSFQKFFTLLKKKKNQLCIQIKKNKLVNKLKNNLFNSNFIVDLDVHRISISTSNQSPTFKRAVPTH